MSTQEKIFKVDAFADRPFAGNPAAVMVRDQFLSDTMMQAIAAENNLAETAFLVPDGGGRYRLRWFTPMAEVPLCGHATLAAAHVLWTELGVTDAVLTFDTKSGPLMVEREVSGYRMDFPSDMPRRIALPDGLAEALGTVPVEVHAGQYLLALVPDGRTLRALTPDYLALSALAVEGQGAPAGCCVCVTAPGAGDYDFVSRFFAPGVGINEDPVTGSAHCMLAPFWADRLGKPRLSAYQASPRGGAVGCEVVGDRVILRGDAVTFLEGVVRLP